MIIDREAREIMWHGTVTGISLAHFLTIFCVAPLGEGGANFGNGRLCKMEFSECLIFSEDIYLFGKNQALGKLHFT